jgi:hypothetical protein
MKELDLLEESNILSQQNLRNRIFKEMESYKLSFEQLSTLTNNKVSSEQLKNFVHGYCPQINGIYLMRICSILGISISSIHRGYFFYNVENAEERDEMEDIYNKSREIDSLIENLGGHMKKSVQEQSESITIIPNSGIGMSCVSKEILFEQYQREHMKKTAQDILMGNTLIIGGPGTGKTYITMEFIKELKELQNSKVLVMDHEHELIEFSKEVGGVALEYKMDEEFPESNSWFTVLNPPRYSRDWFDYLSNNAQTELEKILMYALDNEFDLLILSEDAVSYFLIDHIENYQEYLEKIKVVVQVHALGFCTDVNLEKFMNIIVFASHDVYTTDLLKKTFEIDVAKLIYQKRGEYQVVK